MADIRINALANTASTTASDDYLAVDGTTNGTRKLSAYSPTFGGNFQANGTGTIGGNLTVSGSLLSHQTGVLNLAYEGSSISQLVAYGADASTYGRANIVLRKAGTGVGAVTALSLTDTTATLAGNLTVSGSTLSVGNGITAAAINIGGGGNTGTQLNITSADGNNDYAVRVLQNSTTSSNGLYVRTKGTRSGDNALYVASNDGSDAILTAKNDKSVSVGGNLTVSGSGTSDFSGNVRLANTKAIYGYTFAGATGVLISSSASDNLNVGQNNANWAALNLYGGTGNVDVYSGAAGFVARFNTAGNVLIGSTTNTGQKLQVAGTIRSTGNIESATSSNGYLDLAVANTSAGTSAVSRVYAYNGAYSFALELLGQGFTTSGPRVANRGYLYCDGAQGLTIHSINAPLRFWTGNPGTEALVIDTSQNATFAGTVQLNSDSGLYIKQGNIARWTSTGLSSGTARADMYADSGGSLYIRTNGVTTALTLDSSQNATFSGDIRFSATNSFDVGATGARVRQLFVKTPIISTSTPASASATGTEGTIVWDTSYIYVCTATNTWKRVAIATW